MGVKDVFVDTLRDENLENVYSGMTRSEGCRPQHTKTEIHPKSRTRAERIGGCRVPVKTIKDAKSQAGYSPRIFSAAIGVGPWGTKEYSAATQRNDGYQKVKKDGSAHSRA